MFLRPELKELANFTPEWTLIPSFLADPATDGTRQSNFAILIYKKVALIGNCYTGEMKKGFLH
jgi:phosphoenolpyruvate carboxykinase (ATP)